MLLILKKCVRVYSTLGMKIMDRKFIFRKKAFTLCLFYLLTFSKFFNKKSDNIVKYNEDFNIDDNYSTFAYLNDKKIIFINDEFYYIDDDNVYVVDLRYVTDSDIKICSSYKIISIEDIRNILNILQEYEKRYPSRWNRSNSSMEYEWIVHNLAYYLGIFPSKSMDVDLDNDDEGKLIPKILKKPY